jgi:uncharacterized membrane protein
MDLLLIPRAIVGYILILFVPGYALTLALYPTREELLLIERIALSFVLSVVGVMISVLFADLYLGIDVTPVNIVVITLIVTFLAALIWQARLFQRKGGFREWLRH